MSGNFKKYEIKKETLDRIADGIRAKYNFTEEINPEDFPLYISNDSNVFWLTHFNCNVEAGGVIFTDTTHLAKAKWDYRLWVAFAPDNSYPNCYTITIMQNNLGAASDSAVQIAMPDGGFLYNVSYGTDYPYYGQDYLPNYKNVNSTTAVKTALSWRVGDRFIFENLNLNTLATPTSTPDILWYNDGYKCTATYDIIKEPTITIDGWLDDEGWKSGGWYTVNAQTGVYQVEPTIAKDTSYRYKIRTDDEYIYVAFASNENVVAASAGPTAARIWFKTDDEATVYTHFYEVRWNNTGLTNRACYNTSKTSNSAAAIENSSMEFASTTDLNVCRIEFRVKLSEFNGENGFYYIFDFAQMSFAEQVPEYTEMTNVALGKTYDNPGSLSSTFSYQASITDGTTRDDMSTERNSWYGFFNTYDESMIQYKNTTNGIGTVTVDLEDDYGLYKVRMHICNGGIAGVSVPEYIKIYGSVDNVNFFYLGEMPTNREDTSAVYWSELDIKTVCRYIKVEVLLASHHMFFDELEVYGAIEYHEYLSLYAQPITIDATDRTTNFPYKNWDVATSVHVDPNDIELSSDEAMTLIMEAL